MKFKTYNHKIKPMTKKSDIHNHTKLKLAHVASKRVYQVIILIE
jgi:hypothetical protein